MQSGCPDAIGVTAPRQAFGLIQRLKKRRPGRDSHAGNFTDNKNEKEST